MTPPILSPSHWERCGLQAVTSWFRFLVVSVTHAYHIRLCRFLIVKAGRTYDVIHNTLSCLSESRALNCIGAWLQEMMLAGDLISQLHTQGGLPEWEVYVAATIPDTPQATLGQRSQVTRHMLSRNGPHWGGSQRRQDFLTQEIGIPRLWLLESLSLWCKASGDPSGASPRHECLPLFFMPCRS